MAIYHYQLKTVSRSAGRSATASAAYRSGERLHDLRTGLTYDYSHRSGVMLAEVILPDGGTADREQLWNAAEQAEKRVNSVVAREIVVALPHELSAELQQSLVKDYAQGLSERTGWAVDVAIHEPGKGGDLRNVHAHLLCSTRNVTRDPSGLPVMNQKTRSWDIRSSGSELIRSERSEWERCVNESLEQAQVQSRVDCRSHAEKQTGLEPQIHLGPTVMNMERKGIQTERGDIHRNIRAHNENVLDFQAARAARIDEAFEQEAWKYKLIQMQDWPLERLQEEQAQYRPQSIDAMLSENEAYQVEKAKLEVLETEHNSLVDTLSELESAHTEVVYEWNGFMVLHPWQSSLNNMGVLPVSDVSRMEQSLQDFGEKEAKVEELIHANELAQQEIKKQLEVHWNKLFPEVREKQNKQIKRFQDIETIKAGRDRKRLETESQSFGWMGTYGLERELKECLIWDGRQLALEYSEVKKVALPLAEMIDPYRSYQEAGSYSETKGKELEKALKKSENDLAVSQKNIKLWKEVHPVHAFMCDKNVIYPSGEYAALLKVKVERELEVARAKGTLKDYARGRMRAEVKLEKEIQKVLPACEQVALANKTKYDAIQRVLKPRQEAERKLEEERVRQQRLEQAQTVKLSPEAQYKQSVERIIRESRERDERARKERENGHGWSR